VARGGRVGVDVERLRPVAHPLELAASMLGPAAQAALVELPEQRRSAAFLARWTRWEAYVKACGVGLDAAPGEADARGWSVEPLWPADGFVGAVAMEGRGWRVTTRRWPAA
jgi:4'-phosphopantetheinyl transferase